MRCTIAIIIAAILLSAGCDHPSPAPTGTKGGIRIGFAMDALQEERWQRDRDLFVAHARDLGAEVMVQAASGDPYQQLAQVENMLNRGVNVLVVVPTDAKVLAPIVEQAHAKGIKVIAYDRLMRYVDLDFYVTFDSQRIGELQAEYLARLVPRGNYAYLGGAPGDDNAQLAWRGVHHVLDPLVDRGDIQLVADELSTGSDPAQIGASVNAALIKAGATTNAVIAANDDVAAAAITALGARAPVVGANADLAALRRIRQGTQAMTIYKPIRQLAEKAAEVAVAFARGEQPQSTGTVSNGMKDVPVYVFQPIAVDGTNWLSTVVRDGFHREEEVLGIK